MTRGPILFDDLGPGDVRRHQVGRELNSFEREVEHAGHGAHQQGLRQTRNSGNDRMAANKQREQNLFDYVVLADNCFSDFAQQRFARVTELVQKFFVVDYRFFNRHLVSSLKVAQALACVSEARA